MNETSCKCIECKRKFKIDLLLPDELWNKIKPKKGLLCGSCIMNALEEILNHDYFHLSKAEPSYLIEWILNNSDPKTAILWSIVKNKKSKQVFINRLIKMFLKEQ